MNSKNKKYKLSFNEKEFLRIYFGDSIISTYFDQIRTRSILYLVISLVIVFLIINYFGDNYSLISFLFFTIIISAYFTYQVVNEFYIFNKWRLEVLNFIKKGYRYKNSEITLGDLTFKLETSNSEDTTILNYNSILRLDRYHNRIEINQGNENSFIFPLSSFESEFEFNSFFESLSKMIKK